MAIKLSKKEAADLNRLVTNYETAKTALKDALQNVLDKWVEEFDEKSEKWQESEVGQQAQERIDTLGSWNDEMPEEGEPSIDTDQLT